jgi:TonB-linked SusC/RagA family outer membrane protein
MTGRVIDDRKRASLHFVPFSACAGYTARTQDSGAKKREDSMRERLRLSLAVVLVAGLCAVSGTARAQATRTVTGIVVDNEGGAGIVGASVQVKDTAAVTTQTVAGGSFTLTKVPAGDTTLQVAAEGFLPLDVPVKAGRGNTVVAVYLSKVKVEAAPTRVITGLVRDATTGGPLAGATVKVQGTELGAIADADGLFVLPGVAAADVVLEVSAADHSAAVLTLRACVSAAMVQLLSRVAAPPTDTPAPVAGRTIRGRVTDTANDSVAGATVQVVGTELLAITDENGEFQLDGVGEGDVLLEVQSGGYGTQRISAPAGVASVSPVLKFEAGEEIYITGRAPVIVKNNLANGASVVNDQDLNRVSAATLDTALTGKISGANMQQNSGAPGGGTQLRLRGISTINGQSSPLYVIDGVIVANVSVSGGSNAISGASAGGNPSSQDNPVNRIADLNPNDIENVEVLKGASAAALYGSKAANGVVIITTKRGRTNAGNKVQITQRFGFAQQSNKLGSREFGSLEEVMGQYPNNPRTGAPSPQTVAYMAANGRTFDHEDEITESKLATETIVSASGGTDAGNYYGSILVRDEPGIVKGTYYQKQSGRVSVGYDFGKRLKVQATANLIHTKSDRGLSNNDNTGTSYYVVLASTPNFVSFRRNPDGTYPVNPVVESGSNLLQTVELLDNEEDVWRLVGSTTAGLKVWSNATNNVSLNATFGVDRFQQKNLIYSPAELHFEPVLDGLAGTVVDGSTTNLNANVGAGALWTFAPTSGAFRSALSGGFTYEYQDQDSVFAIAQNLNPGASSVDSATSLSVTQARQRSKDQGFYLQEEVAVLDDSLSLLAGALAERSSLNGDTDKFFLFPKVAATYAVPVPKETFETLRVRAAYGEAGNRPLYAQKFTALNATGIIDGNGTLTTGNNIGDADIEPERQREFEIGLDGALADQKVVLELTGYQRNISNLLLQRTLPDTSGFVTEFLNGGKMRNLGVEAALQVAPLSGPFEWVSRATFTLNRSKVTELPEGIGPFDVAAAGFGSGLGVFRIEEGKSATQIVAPAGEAGIVAVGDGEPDFRVGWANNFTWKQFGLTSLIDWQQGSDVVNLTRLLYDFGGVADDPEGTAERLAAFGADDMRPYIEDASFVKVREVSVFYDLPENVAKQLGPLSTLRVTVSGRNLLTFTGYSGLDPEVSNFGNQPIGRNYDVAPYPPSRSFWFSVDAGF